MSNNNVAIVSLMAQFDEKSVNVAAEKLGKTTAKAFKDIGKDELSQDIVSQFTKAMNTVKGKLKGVNLSSYTNNILDSIISDKDIAEKIKELEDFISNIKALSKSLSGLDSNALNSMNTKQLDAIINKQKKIDKKNEEIINKTQSLNSTANSAARTERSASSLVKKYGKSDYEQSYESLKKLLQTNNSFDDSQQKSIKHLSEMLSLYSDMEKVQPEKGTKEAISYSVDLLTIVKEIQKTSQEIDLYTNGKASKFVNKNYDSMKSVNEYNVESSKSDFVKSGLSALQTQKAKLEKELTEYIGKSVEKNLQKMTDNSEKYIDSVTKKAEKLQTTIDTLSQPKSDKQLVDNIVDESQLKSLEEIEDRLYAISDLDADGEATKQQLKEYIQLYKQYEQLITSDSTVKFDPGLKEEYDSIVESDSKLKKYADTLDETISKQKELNTVKSDKNEVSADKQTEQLVKQEEQIKETIQAEKQLQDTQEKVSSNTKISVDAEQAIADINKIKENLNSIPEEKNIKITISDSDYTNTPLLSDAEGNTITAFRGVVGAWSGLINQDGIGFFTDKLELAADYADSLAESGKVFQANLSFHNPLEIEGNGAKWNEIDFDGGKHTTDEIIQIAKDLGYDGVIFKNIRDGFSDTEEDISNVMVALNAAQIKNEQVVGAVKAGTGELTNVASNSNNISDNVTTSVIDSQNKIQNELQETQNQAEKTAQAVKEVTSTATTPQESNISSGNKIINEQKTIQSEVNKTRENIKLLSDEYGQLIYANRGVSHTYGAGLNSNRYHGGTFWTKSTDLAAKYGSKIEVANLSMNNPLEVDNKGNNWDEIELYENELTKLQGHIEKIKYKSETIQEELNSLSDNDDGFKLPSFDIDYDGNILSSYGNNIDVVESLEKFRDLFFGFVDLDDPKIQKSITDLYGYLQSYARMTQLLNSEQLNTNQVVEIAKELGHDGVIFKNIIDGSDEVTDIFVTLSQDQVHYVETLDSMTVKEKLAKSKAQKLVESRKQLYENIKTFSDLDFDSVIKDFQEGIIPNIWSEFLNTQDFDDDFNNIKANLLKYVSELKSEFELPRKDAFPSSSTDTKPEAEGMQEVEKITKEAVQAKKDFATANEGVQSSIDDSENPLKLEAELMDQIAKSAREAADAKKEFVEANKQVKNSADDNDSELDNNQEKKKQDDSDIQKQKDAFNKSNLNAIDMEIKKREEESKINSSLLKSQMEQQVQYENQLKKINSTASNYRNDVNGYKKDSGKTGYLATNNYLQKIEKYESQVKSLESYVSDLHDQEFITDKQLNKLEVFKKRCEEAKQELKDMKASDKGSWTVDVQKEIDKINSDLSKNSNYSKQAKEQLKAFVEQLKSGNISDTTLKAIHEEFLRITNAEKLAGREGKNFFDIVSNSRLHQIAAQLAGMFSIYDVINAGREGINVVRELDEAMTEVRKVSEATESQYSSFQKTISSTAKEIASTNKELLNSSADFLRLGYSLDQANDLAKNATLFVNVGDGVDITSATEDMITAMKAFDIQAEDSIKIVDDYNQIGNKYALSATDIGEAMKRSASALETGNNTFEESIGLITAMNEIVQNSENTGNTLKVLSLRLRGAKAELESMSEDTDGLCDSTSKLREQIQALTGVDIMVDDNTFKSTADIIKELGAVWGNLTDSSQAATLEIIAGKTRANNVAALLKNYQQIDNVVSDLGDAQGSAERENAAIVDSINGRIKVLSASAEEFWQSFINTDAVKNAITAATDLLNILTKITDNINVIPTLLGMLGSFGMSKLGEGSLD